MECSAFEYNKQIQKQMNQQGWHGSVKYLRKLFFTNIVDEESHAMGKGGFAAVKEVIDFDSLTIMAKKTFAKME